MSIHLILNILFAHYVGDFICQTKWQATNKSKNILALLLHVTTYSLTIFAILWYQFDLNTLVYWTLLNFIGHFAVDFVTSKITSHFYTKGNMHPFWITIGFDQFLHYTILLSMAQWLIN